MKMWRNRALRIACIGVWAGLASASTISLGPTHAAATGPRVVGGGSSWVFIALDQWRADIARQGYNIDYSSIGSSAGRQEYLLNQLDFAASEIPFQPDELPQLTRSYQYIPDVAGGTSLVYNLHHADGSMITDLRLDATTAAGIFTGTITSWQDPAIQALNPGLQIAETTITPVIRSDGSGTSAQFSLYLADQASGPWNAFVNNPNYACPAPCSLWPPFPGSTQQNGSDGVAGFVSKAIGDGSIGYVEAGYAYGRGFPVASMKNAGGSFVQPYSFNVSVALQKATLNGDLTQNLSGVYRDTDPNAYPISSYSYLITQTSGFDPGKGNVLGNWLIYIACGGQQEAAGLGYSPLPKNLVQDVFDAVRRLPGAPTPPPIDAQHCPNPQVTGQGPGGVPAGAPGTHSGGGGTTSSSSGPLASASASASAAAASAAATAGATGSATPGGVSLLSPAQREAAFIAAEEAAKRAQAPPLLPLLAACGLVLAAVFVPAFLGWRRSPRSRGIGS